MSKIQMQPGMSLNQFLTKFGEEQQCEASLEDARWPEGFRATVNITTGTDVTV